MAWFTIAKPGTNAGPCEAECQHVDCRESRMTAAKHCRYCGKPLGYESKLSGDPLAHFDCLLEAASC